MLTVHSFQQQMKMKREMNNFAHITAANHLAGKIPCRNPPLLLTYGVERNTLRRR